MSSPANSVKFNSLSALQAVENLHALEIPEPEDLTDLIPGVSLPAQRIPLAKLAFPELSLLFASGSITSRLNQELSVESTILGKPSAPALASTIKLGSLSEISVPESGEFISASLQTEIGISPLTTSLNQTREPLVVPELLKKLDTLAANLQSNSSISTQELKIKTTVPVLGDLEIRLSREDGNLKVSMVAEDRQAEKLLRKHADGLQRHLEGEGIAVEQIDIQTSARNAGSHQQISRELTETELATAEPNVPEAEESTARQYSAPNSQNDLLRRGTFLKTVDFQI